MSVREIREFSFEILSRLNHYIADVTNGICRPDHRRVRMPSWEKVAEEAMDHFGDSVTCRFRDETRLNLQFQTEHPDEYVAYWDEEKQIGGQPRIVQRHVLATGKSLSEINERMSHEHGENWTTKLRQRGVRVDFFPAVEIH